MEDKINQALVQLENELQGIVSAREQVEKTVKSSTELQNVVAEYVSSVKTLCKGLQSWEKDLRAQGTSLSTEFQSAISNLNSTCSEIINTFDTNVEKTSTDFKTKTDGTITKFVEQNKQLSEKVLELNTLSGEIKKAIDEIKPLKESLTQISKDLEKSQKEQDKVLDDIKQVTDVLPTTIQNGIGTVSAAISSSENIISSAVSSSFNTIVQTIKASETTLSNGINQLNVNLNTLAANVANIAAWNQTIHSAIGEVSQTLKNSSDEMLMALNQQTKSSNINRWIIIVGIIILAVLQFIIK